MIWQNGVLVVVTSIVTNLLEIRNAKMSCFAPVTQSDIKAQITRQLIALRTPTLPLHSPHHNLTMLSNALTTKCMKARQHCHGGSIKIDANGAAEAAV
jgi:hypothetical protein